MISGLAWPTNPTLPYPTLISSRLLPSVLRLNEDN